MPSQLEILNASKVYDMLTKIEGITIENIREDIFKVTEHETGNNLSVIVDVEETTVVLLIDIDSYNCIFAAEYLLQLNGEISHGKFCIIDKKIVMKDVLEILHLDQNELEASLSSMITTLHSSIEKICDINVQA